MSLGTHHGAFSLIATDLLGGRPRIERVIISAARVKFRHGQQPFIDRPV